MTNTELKFLKYKQKFLQLKNLIGGGREEDLAKIQEILKEYAITEDVINLSIRIYDNLQKRIINENTVFLILGEIEYFTSTDKAEQRLTAKQLLTSEQLLAADATEKSLAGRESHTAVQDITLLINKKELTVDNFKRYLPEIGYIYLMEIEDLGITDLKKTYYKISSSYIYETIHVIYITNDKTQVRGTEISEIESYKIEDSSDLLEYIVKELLSKKIIILTEDEYELHYLSISNKYRHF